MAEVQDVSLPFLTRKQLAFEHGTRFSLEITSFTEGQADLEIRGLTKEGPFVYIQRIGPTTNQQNFSLRIPDVPIMLSITKFLSTGALNSINVIVKLGINGVGTIVLCQGYISMHTGLAWPHQIPLGKLEKVGVVRALTLGGLGAGAELNFTVASNKFLLIRAIQMRFVADATVASRRVTLRITQDGNRAGHFPSAGDITAGQDYRLVWFPGATLINDATGFIQSMGFPNEMLLNEGANIETVTKNIQVGDQISELSAYVQEYRTTI